MEKILQAVRFNWYVDKTRQKKGKGNKTPAIITPNIKRGLKHLSDLLDTHQDQPTEVRRRDQVKIITTPWHETQTLQAARVTREAGAHGFTLGRRGHSSHQQGWRFCGSFKELRRGRLL